MIEASKLDELSRKLDERYAVLVAVSKTRSDEQIMTLFEQGQRAFGENRVQELVAKQPRLTSEIEWHMIGHLQRNKVKQIAPFVAMIESVDSPRLLREIDKQAERCGRSIPVLLQVHIAGEAQKFGFYPDELREWLADGEYASLEHVEIRGLMGMATFTDDRDQIREEFRSLAKLMQQLKEDYFASEEGFRELSMGMSGDWEIALEEGATMVRIGSLLFGPRAA